MAKRGGDSIPLSELTVPDGVELTLLAGGGDDVPVVSVHSVQIAEEEEEGEGPEALKLRVKWIQTQLLPKVDRQLLNMGPALLPGLIQSGHFSCLRLQSTTDGRSSIGCSPGYNRSLYRR